MAHVKSIADNTSADPQEWRVAVDGDAATALYEPAADERAVFVCAHGAGGHMRDRSMESLSRALRERGLSIVRFNFLYREHGSGRPDPMPRLEQCMSAVIEHARTTLQPRKLVIGGRSMGGRAASMLAANGVACDGLLLFAYPLHPAGKPETLRDTHLGRIDVPVLCFNGTRDALCTRDLMEGVIVKLRANWQMHWLEGADHSFYVLKKSGRTNEDVMDEVSGATAQWLDTVDRSG
jgi:uncharacterized protein